MEVWCKRSIVNPPKGIFEEKSSFLPVLKELLGEKYVHNTYYICEIDLFKPNVFLLINRHKMSTTLIFFLFCLYFFLFLMYKSLFIFFFVFNHFKNFTIFTAQLFKIFPRQKKQFTFINTHNIKHSLMI